MSQRGTGVLDGCHKEVRGFLTGVTKRYGGSYGCHKEVWWFSTGVTKRYGGSSRVSQRGTVVLNR